MYRQWYAKASRDVAKIGGAAGPYPMPRTPNMKRRADAASAGRTPETRKRDEALRLAEWERAALMLMDKPELDEADRERLSALQREIERLKAEAADSASR